MTVVGSFRQTGTSGGIGAVYDAGVRHGMTILGIDKECAGYDSISGSSFNSLLQAAGKLEEAPHLFHFVSRPMINKPSAFGRYLNRLPDDSKQKWAASYILSRPAAIQRAIARIPEGRLKDMVAHASDIAVMDPIRKFKQLIDENIEKPIVDLSCLDSVIDKLYGPQEYERLRNFPVPLNAIAYNITEGRRETLDMRVHGPKAARASSCFVGCVRYGEAEYADVAFRGPIDYAALTPAPRVIVVNHGQRTWMGDYQAKVFLVAEFGPEMYNRYIRDRETEEKALKQFRHDPGTLILRPDTDIHFATKDRKVIDKTFEAGVRDATKIEKFLERSRKSLALAA